MRFLTCGADSILVELADLDETLRVFAALQSTSPSIRCFRRVSN